jgi:2-(acetamidomethylene)succinate hydrolase
MVPPDTEYARAERTWALPGIELHGWETGSAGSGTPLIMLHGITSNGRGWDPVADILAPRYRTIALDQRGHGRSGKPTGPCYGRDDFAGDVIALIEALNAGPAVIAGHSLGARNALAAGAMRPDLVSAVIAIEFTPFIEDGVMDTLDARVHGGDRDFASLDEIRDYLSGRYKMMPADAIERRARFGYERNGNGVYRPLADGAAMAATSTGLRDDIETALRTIRIPTLLVRGAQSTLVSEAAFERACALRPDLPTAIFDECDHYITEEQPAKTAAMIDNFVTGGMTGA